MNQVLEWFFHTPSPGSLRRQTALGTPGQLWGGASDHQEPTMGSETWPQNKAAAQPSPMVIEFRILLKLEGEAD